MRRSFAASLLVHVAILALVMLGLPSTPTPPEIDETAVSIDVVELAEFANLPSRPEPTVSASEAMPAPEPPTSTAAAEPAPEPEAEEPVQQAAPAPSPPPTPEPPEPQPAPQPEPAVASPPEPAPPVPPVSPAERAARAAPPEPPAVETPAEPAPSIRPPTPRAAVPRPQPEPEPAPEPETPPTPAETAKPAPPKVQPKPAAPKPAPEPAVAAKEKQKEKEKAPEEPAKAEQPKPATAKPKPADGDTGEPSDFASVSKAVRGLDRKPAGREFEADGPGSFEDRIARALGSTGPTGSTGSPAGNRALPVTTGEIDAVRRQIERCWSLPSGAKEADNLVVAVQVEMNADGTPQRARVEDSHQMQTDPFYRAAAESALRAVLNPRCHPFKLPAEKYQTWKTMTLVFNPKEMFGT